MKVMINTKKSTQEILQEEMLRERVAVLARAGERLAEAMEKLRKMEGCIAEKRAALRQGDVGKDDVRIASRGFKAGDRPLLAEINDMIRAYNLQREQVQTRYYYLIVTREALGIIHHQRLAEIYRIPPKIRCQPEA